MATIPFLEDLKQLSHTLRIYYTDLLGHHHFFRFPLLPIPISVPNSIFVSRFRSCKPFKQSINQTALDHQTPVNQPNISIVVQLVEPTGQKWIQVVCYAKQDERAIGKVDWTTKSNEMRNGGSAGVATRNKGKFFRGLCILDHRGFGDCHCPLGNQNSLNQVPYHLQS